MARGDLVVDIIARDNASKAFDKVAGSASKSSKILSTGAKVAGLGLLAGGAAAVAFGKSAISSASDAQQSLGATETVFGKAADSIIAKSKKASTAVGLSANDYRETANVIGSLFSNKGLKGDELAKQTDLVVKKGADLSATFGGSAKEAVEALGAAFKGEFDPLERYGISLKQSTINTEAETLAKQKYGKSLKDLSTAQQNAISRQATQNLINQQSAKSQGAFARETDTLAHKQQVLGAQFEDLQAKLGTLLLPIITQVTQKFISLTGWVDKNRTTVGIAVAALAAFAAAVIAVNAVVKIWGAVTKAYVAVQTALNFALSANPIGLVVIAIAALVAAFVIAYKKSDTFRAIVQGAFAGVKAAAAAVAGFFTNQVPAAFNKVVGAARSVLSWVRGNWPLLLGILTGPIGLAVVGIAKNWSRIKAGATDVKNWIRDRFADIVGFAKALPGRITAVASGAFNGLKNAFRAALNSIISGWNRLSFKIPSVDTHIPGVGRVGGATISTPNIPYLASGGIVSRPTLAVIGEAGPEAVIPLDRLSGGGIDEVRLAQLLETAFRNALEAVGIEVSGKISGPDILLSAQRTLVKQGSRNVFAS